MVKLNFFIAMVLEEEQDDDGWIRSMYWKYYSFENVWEQGQKGVYELLVLKHHSDKDAKF